MFTTNPAEPWVATTTSFVTALAMTILCATALFGIPSCTTAGSAEDTLQKTTRQIASGHAEQALAVLKAFRDAHPDQAIIDRQIARAYAALDRPADEAAAWESFLQKSPVGGDGCDRLAALRRRMHADTHQIITILERCLQASPAEPGLLAQLALAYDAAGDREAANTAYQRAIRFDPDNPTLLVRLGQRMLADGRFADARRCADAALRSSPARPDAVYLAAAAAEGLGDVAAARRWVDRGLAITPDDETLTAMRLRLVHQG